MQTDAIWIIDSDEDDQLMIREVWRELKLNNELVFLENAEAALKHLGEIDTAPFVIICELNLQKIDGFELRERMLSKKSRIFRSVPFIFWSTEVSESQIIRAYDLSVHGLFIKDSTFDELKKTFTSILNYWLKSKMPSKNVHA
jgi:DNA-binding NarL/FixJ family response regulator